jgi:peroxiredoxin Q/BCP
LGIRFFLQWIRRCLADELHLATTVKRVVLIAALVATAVVAVMSLKSFFFPAKSGGELVKPYPAPKSEGIDQDGHTVKLEDYYKRGLTLVYFYPMADTPGCTKQACSLRDGYEQLREQGVQVVGVSRDKQAAQKKFQDKFHLPFVLLADPEGKIVSDFGVGSFLGFASREAYLIKDSMVVWRDKHASTEKQAADVLQILKKYKQG